MPPAAGHYQKQCAAIGVALNDGEPHRGEDVIRDAELAMYHGKRLGGDRMPPQRELRGQKATFDEDYAREVPE